MKTNPPARLAASLIIPTLNREQPLVASIESALSQDFAGYEVIVVDQTEHHSAPVAHRLATLAKDSRLVVIKEKAKSLPNARNIGIAAAKGEYVIFIDDDVDLPVGFLTSHIEFMRTYGCVAAGGRVLQHNRPTDSIPIRFNALSRTKGDGFGGQMIREVDTFRGCNMAMERTIFDEVGLFDTNYTGSATREESDLALRIRKQGMPILFNPAAVLWHLEDDDGGCNTDNGQGRERVEKAEFFKNDSLFFLKHFHNILFPLYVLGMYKAFVFKPRFFKRGLVFRQVVVVGGGCLQGVWLYVRLKASGQLLS